jgi:hypothetical protein
MKSINLWDMTPFKVNRRYGATYYLFLLTAITLLSCLAYSSTPKMSRYILPKCRLISNGLRVLISQMIVLFISQVHSKMNFPYIYLLVDVLNINIRHKKINSNFKHTFPYILLHPNPESQCASMLTLHHSCFRSRIM